MLLDTVKLKTLADEPEGGFLKLTKTQEWLLGETSAPINRKPTNKEIQDTRERRRRLSLLSYEALKSELVFFTLAVGAACTGYCLLIFSAQAAVSYASGVGFSYLYLRLLYQYVDKLSRDSIPLIFRQRKPKKIGIRSEDLQDSFEKSVKGVGLALSSPRLVIPATIYGLWILLHRSFASDIFDFQIVPAMMGLFAYKAAALIQGFFDVAEELGFNVGLKHKKINISNPRVACEHEQFSRLRVTAATLSGLSSPPEFLENFGGLSDSRHFVSESAVIKGVKLVAEALARQIYGLDGKNTEIFAEGSSLAVNPSYITSWLNLMSRTPRVAPFLTKTDPIVNALRK